MELDLVLLAAGGGELNPDPTTLIHHRSNKLALGPNESRVDTGGNAQRNISDRFLQHGEIVCEKKKKKNHTIK